MSFRKILPIAADRRADHKKPRPCHEKHGRKPGAHRPRRPIEH